MVTIRIMKFLLVVVGVISCSVFVINGNNINIGKPLNIKQWSRADKKLATILIDMYHDTKDAEHSFLLHFENSQQMFNEIKKENISPSLEEHHKPKEKGEKEEMIKEEMIKEEMIKEEMIKEEMTKEEMIKEEMIKGANEEITTKGEKESSVKTDDSISPNSTKPQRQNSELKHSSFLSVASPVSSTVPRFTQLKTKGPVEEETIWRAIYDTQLRRSPPTANVFVLSEENIEKEFDLAKMDAYASQISKMKNRFEQNLHYMSKELSRQKRIKETLKEVLILEEEIRSMKQKKKVIRGGPIRRENDATKTEC